MDLENWRKVKRAQAAKENSFDPEINTENDEYFADMTLGWLIIKVVMDESHTTGIGRHEHVRREFLTHACVNGGMLTLKPWQIDLIITSAETILSTVSFCALLKLVDPKEYESLASKDA